jgi:hypothetical protein
LGGEFKHLVNRFNRMRIKRHDFIYDTEKPIPRTEAIHSLESAEQFVMEITWRFRTKSATDSDPNRPPNPFEIGHRFRSKSAGHSDPNRPPLGGVK